MFGTKENRMMSLRKKMIMAAVGIGAMLLATGTTGYAVPNSLPHGTTVDIVGNLHFTEGINGVLVKVRCSSFIASGVIGGPAHLNFTASPTISGCTDSLSGTDTITTNSTWFLAAVTATVMKLGIPTAGATFTSTALAGCTITWASSGLVKLTGTYNGVNTETITDQPLVASGAGCAAGTMKTWVNAHMSPHPGAVPPWN
jgi:hypothetical protein